MNQRQSNAIALMRWTLGLVVLYESCMLAFEPGRIHSFEHSGLPHFLRPVLAGGEILAAALFLLPLTTALGGYLLLITFAFATLVHILHGQYDVGALIVYSTAVWVIVEGWKGKSEGGAGGKAIEAVDSRL